MTDRHGSVRTITSWLPRLCVTIMTLTMFTCFIPTTHASNQPLFSLPQSVPEWTQGATMLHRHNLSDQLTVAVILQISHRDEQRRLLSALYNPHSPLYHSWLKTGEFAARFAPEAKIISIADEFLKRWGLHILPNSPSPAMLLAQGTIHQLELAFHTTINDYQLANGASYFANSTSIQLPANLSGDIIGVLGLSNSIQQEPRFMVSRSQDRHSSRLSPPYGGGPYGRGLTPSQIAGIYNITPVYKTLKTSGQGVTLGLFELSDYTRKDIAVYEKAFNLPDVRLVDRPIFGGPTSSNGALEVELDIELQVATAPGVKQINVYNAPNTDLGVVGQYLQIARDNQADAISTSWGVVCEYFVSSQVSQAENIAFIQMALQGQSLFAASGDAGAFSCSRIGLLLPLPMSLQIGDPDDQPYITSVGGTSFRKPNGGPVNFDPSHNPNPTYPGTQAEQVWNGGCNAASCSGGAGGGGVSRIWGSGDYIYDPVMSRALPGTINVFSRTGEYCNQQPFVVCRQSPDVAINGDPGTGYAMFCTNTVGECLNPAYSANGWIRVGGTSCGSPIWAGIAALYDSYHKGRRGLFNFYVYPFDSSSGYSHQLHDITIGDNGYYPAGPTYDLATGVGTPNTYYLIAP